MAALTKCDIYRKFVVVVIRRYSINKLLMFKSDFSTLSNISHSRFLIESK